MHYVILPTAVITFLLFFGILDFTGKKFDKLAEKHHREDVNNYLFQMDYKACKNLDPSIKKADVLKMRERTRINTSPHSGLYYLVSTDGGKYWHNITYEIQEKFNSKKDYCLYTVSIPARYFLESRNNGQKIKVKIADFKIITPDSTENPFDNKHEQKFRRDYITRYKEELSRAENCKKNNEIFYIHDYFKYPYDPHEYFSTDNFWEREFNKPNELKFHPAFSEQQYPTEYYINLLKKCIKLNEIRIKELKEELTVYKDINDEERLYKLEDFDKRYKFFDIPIYDIINRKYSNIVILSTDRKFHKHDSGYNDESDFAKIQQKDGLLFIEKSLDLKYDYKFELYDIYDKHKIYEYYYHDFFDKDEKEIIEIIKTTKDDEKVNSCMTFLSNYEEYKCSVHLPKPFRNINPDFSEDKYNNASIYKYYENEMPFIKNLLVKTQDLDNSKRSRDFWWEVIMVFCNILDFFGYYSYQ